MKTLASLALLFVASAAYGQTATVKLDNLPVKYGSTLSASGTFAGRLGNNIRCEVQVLVRQDGRIVYQRGEWVTPPPWPNGNYNVKFTDFFPLVQQDVFTASGIFWDSSRPAVGTIQVRYIVFQGKRITVSVLAGPINFAIGAK